MSLITASANSAVLGDLYALQQFIYESKIGADTFYFQLAEGSFSRPSYYIKLVTSNIMPHHQSYREISSQIMVQYFTEDYYDAQGVANDLQMLFSGGPLFADVVLPRYDFSVYPPEKYTTSGWDGDFTYVGDATMGARIDPTTVSNGGIIQEENRGWNVPITFTMESPLPTFQEFPNIEDVIFSILTGKPLLPQVVKACVRGLPSVDAATI